MRWHPEESKFMVFLEIVVSEDTICKHHWAKCDLEFRWDHPSIFRGLWFWFLWYHNLLEINQLLCSYHRTSKWNEGRKEEGLLWWSSKNPRANARNTGSIPGPGRSPCQGATKPVHHKYCARKPKLLKLECSDSALRCSGMHRWVCPPQRWVALLPCN